MSLPKTVAASSPPLPRNANGSATAPARPGGHQAALVVTLGEGLGRKYDLGDRTMTIGHASECDIEVSEWNAQAAPAVRATVRLSDGGVAVEAVGEDSTVFANDRAVTKAELADGDRLSVGRTIFQCLVGPDLHRSYHQTIYEMSTLDSLTRLFNRRFFAETLRREIGRAKRYNEPLALALLDLDHFKRVNDVYGMRVGDLVLTTVAKLTMDWAGEGDWVARYGGEELAIVLPKHDLEAGIDRLGELRLQIESTDIPFEGEHLSITASIGLAILDAEDDLDALIRRADGRLQQAKQTGRNRLAHE